MEIIKDNEEIVPVLNAVDLYYLALAAYIKRYKNKGITPILPDRQSSTIGRENCYLRKDGFLLAIYNSHIQNFRELTQELIDRHTTHK